MAQWIRSSTLNFGIGVRSQLAAILLFCIRFYLFVNMKLVLCVSIDNNINCDKCVFNISLYLMLTFIFHAFICLISFQQWQQNQTFEDTATVKLWKIVAWAMLLSECFLKLCAQMQHNLFNFNLWLVADLLGLSLFPKSCKVLHDYLSFFQFCLHVSCITFAFIKINIVNK